MVLQKTIALENFRKFLINQKTKSGGAVFVRFVACDFTERHAPLHIFSGEYSKISKVSQKNLEKFSSHLDFNLLNVPKWSDTL